MQERSGSIFLVTGLLMALLMTVGGCGKTDLTAEEYVERAQAHFERGAIDASLIEFRNAAQRAPRNAEIRRRLGELHLLQEDPAAAEQDLRRALELGDAGPVTRLALVQALVRQAKFADALAVDIDPDEVEGTRRAELLAARGDAHLGNGDIAAATEAYARALAAEPGFAPGRLGQINAALAKDAVEEAQRSLDALLADRPDYTRAWLLKGDLALSLQRPAEAEASFSEALRTSPGLGGRMNPLAYQAHAGLAFSLVAQNKADEAEEHASAMAGAAPGHFLARYLQGLTAYSRGDHGAARTHLQESHAADRNYTPTLLLLGAVEYALGNYTQAEAHLSRFSAQAPRNVQARKLLGATRLQLAQPARAMEALNDAVDLSPEDVQLLALVGTAALRMGDTATGRDYLQRVIARGGDGEEMHTELAKAYLDEGEYERAIAELQQRLPSGGTTVAETEVLLIMAHLRQRQFDEAEGLARKTLKDHPGDPLVQTLLGEVHLARGDTAKARREFEVAIGSAPDFVPARLNLGNMALREEDLAEARKHYRAVPAEGAGGSAAMMGLARISVREGDERAGIQWLEKAHAADPSAIEPRLALGEIRLRQGDVEKTRSLAGEVLRTHPDHIEALKLMTEAQIRLGRLQDAEVTLNRLAGLQPDSAEVRFRLGQVTSERGRYDAARAAFRKALDLQAEHLPATVALALLEQHTGNSAAAMALSDRVKKSRPDSPIGYMLQGDLLMSQGDARAAVTAYEEAARREPSAQLTIKYHRALLRTEGADVARKPLEAWLEERPGDTPVRLALADAWRAVEDLPNAKAEYERVLEGEPENVVALNNLAWMVYHIDRDPRGLTYAERAHRLRPNDPLIADTLGWILAQEGRDSQRAVRLLRSAAQALPDFPDVQYHLAAALGKSGRKEEARTILDRVLGSGQSFPERSAAEALLAQLDEERAEPATP